MVGDGMEKVVRTKKGKSKNRKIGMRYYDFNLAFLILFACAIGLIIIYSASAYIAKSKNLESTYFLKRQLITIGAGFGLMILFSFINYISARYPAFRDDSFTGIYEFSCTYT